jgi:hypothetical protein
MLPLWRSLPGCCSLSPAGAAQFLKANNLDSKIIFTDYLASSYLLYQLNPNFKMKKFNLFVKNKVLQINKLNSLFIRFHKFFAC